MISIILPVFNGDNFLEKSINSVLNQIYTDYELLVINDGSTDKSQEIIERYISIWPQIIKGFKQNNSGVSSARNYGIIKAKGSYIAFLDQDDIWHPNKLKLQVDIFDRYNDVGLVTCRRFNINNYGEKLPGNILFTPIVNKSELINGMLIKNILGPPSCIMIRKKLLEDVGLFDTTLSSCCEDRDLWLRICKTYPYYSINEELCGYRIHENNAYKNLPKMKLLQRQFINKHMSLYTKTLLKKAYSHIYLDAAREYWAVGRRSKTFINSLISILLCTSKIDDTDDKYYLLIKSILSWIRR